MRSIGQKNKKLVMELTLLAMKKRDLTKKENVLRYEGVVNEIIESLSSDLWHTWEGADGEIRHIIEETIMEN